MQLRSHANTPTTEQLCREAGQVQKHRLHGNCENMKGGDLMGQKDDVLTDDLRQAIMKLL